MTPWFEDVVHSLNVEWCKLKNNVHKIWNYGTIDMFLDLNIETTTHCNRRCSFCPNSIYDRGTPENEKQMPTWLYRKIVDELAEMNWKGRLSPHHYGEPLLDERILKLVAYAKEKLPKSRIWITTNGDFLTVEMYGQLVDAGVTRFVITQYDEQMSNMLKNLFSYLKVNPRRKVEIDYRVFTPETPLYNRGGLINPKTILYTPRCHSLNNPLVIDYEGNVLLCCNDYLSTIKYGNLKKERLLDVWNKQEFKVLRRELKNGVLRLPICQKCVGHTSVQ